MSKMEYDERDGAANSFEIKNFPIIVMVDPLSNRQPNKAILNKKSNSMSEVDRNVFIIIVTLTVLLLLSSVSTQNIREIACHSIVQTVKGYFCVHFATISLTFMHIL